MKQNVNKQFGIPLKLLLHFLILLLLHPLSLLLFLPPSPLRHLKKLNKNDKNQGKGDKQEFQANENFREKMQRFLFVFRQLFREISYFFAEMI